jgi:hypothetical protein
MAKKTPEQKRIDDLIAAFAILLAKTPVEERLAKLNSFPGVLQKASKGFSAEGQNYRFQALRDFNRDYHEAARANVENVVEKPIQILNTATKAIEAKQKLVQHKTVNQAEKPQSFFARAISFLSNMFFGAKNAKSQEIKPQQHEQVSNNKPSDNNRSIVGIAPNILGSNPSSQLVTDGTPASYANSTKPQAEISDPEPIVQGMLGEEQAQAVIDQIEDKLAKSDPVTYKVDKHHSTSYAGDAVEKIVGDAIVRAEAEDPLDSIADMRQSFSEAYEESKRVASAIQGGKIGIAAGSFATAAKESNQASADATKAKGPHNG